MNRILYIIVVLALLYQPLFAQTELNEDPHQVEHKNLAILFVGNTTILQSGFNLPTIGVEYIRELNHTFGLGLIAEMELGSHIVQTDEDGIIVSETHRQKAVLILPSAFVRLYKGLIFTAGYGVELEASENLALMKFGMEYILLLKDPRWIVLPNVSWDHTRLFDSFVYGVSFGYTF